MSTTEERVAFAEANDINGAAAFIISFLDLYGIPADPLIAAQALADMMRFLRFKIELPPKAKQWRENAAGEATLASCPTSNAD